MKQILKVNNSELSFRLKLNYNNVYSRLKMLLGKSANIFADVMTKSAATTWYSNDDAEYTALSEAPKSEMRTILVSLNSKLKAIKKELSTSPELAPFADDILEVPDNNYIFYRQTPSGYDFVLAGWGCKLAHTGVSDTGGIIKRISKTIGHDEEHEKTGKIIDIDDFGDDVADNGDNVIDSNDKTGGNPSDKKSDVTEPKKSDNDSDIDKPNDNVGEKKEDIITPKKKKEQHVVIRVINQNQKPVEDESVNIRTENGVLDGYTDENGEYDLGNLPYHSTFGVQFPDMPSIQERTFEVEPKVERYEVYIKKYVNYSPVLFVEDQNGNVVDNYNVKVVIAGQDTTLNTGSNGMIQLPTMQEGQKFIVIDSANYANSQEYSVTPENVKAPYHFTIKRTVKSKVGITVLDKDKKPLEGVTVDVNSGSTPCQQATDKDGRAEFPSEVFSLGDVDLTLYTKGKGTIKSKLNYTPDTTEYSIQLQGKKPGPGFNWKWLMLLPLLLLLGFGGKWLYDYIHKSDVPTIAEMETGVCLILGQGFYYVDLNVPDITVDGNPAIAYFNYNDNTKEVSNLTFDPNKATVQGWWGTGFLISDDGLIATNKHVAAPTAPDDVAKQLKRKFQDTKDMFQKEADRLNDKLQILGGIGALNQEYANTRDTLRYCQDQIRIFDKLLNTGEFKVQVKSQTRVAFTNTRIEDAEDFIACSQPRAVGDPGGVTEKDLAIIQIKKKQDIPHGAFIFTIPEVDLMDGDVPDNYDVTVLGYNAGGNLQDMDLQEGIKPQAQHGKITNTSEKYRVGYDAPIIGGSSGSPVINNKGELVAINNSGLGITQGFNYGVRTKYLKELLDQLKKTGNKDKKTNDK